MVFDMLRIRGIMPAYPPTCGFRADITAILIGFDGFTIFLIKLYRQKNFS